MGSRNFFVKMIVIALILKLALFTVAEFNAPQVKFEPDTPSYLKPAVMMAEEGIFAQKKSDGSLYYDIFRTPGYPLFLAIFHLTLKIPLQGIILMQILMTILTAWIVYLTAMKFDNRIANLAFLIMLFDPPSAVYPLMIMTEALFTLLLATFLYFIISYLKEVRITSLALAGLSLCAATFVRPISYYLGFAVTIFIFCAVFRLGFRKAILHALIFFVATYAAIGCWTYRNHQRLGKTLFSSSAKNNLHAFGLAGSYSRNEDPHSQGLPPVAYYLNVTSRCAMSLMTRPVNFKYFNSKPLKIAGKVVTYPWVVFWIIGFFVGIGKINWKDPKQLFVAMVICYLAAASIGGVMWYVGSRFRMPMVPFIALFSAYGWIHITSWLKLKGRLKN